MNRFYMGFIPNKVGKVQKPFRATHIVTNIYDIGRATITGLFFNGKKEEHNQLAMSVDANQFSTTELEKARRLFLEKYGLEKKSIKEIDKYLDDNELSIPEPNRLTLPSLNQGASVLITGTGFKEGDIITLIGWVP